MNFDKRLWWMVRAVRAQFFLSVALALLAGIMLMAQAYALSQAIDRVYLKGADLDAILPLLAALLVIALARAGFLWGSTVFSKAVAVRVKAELRERLYTHLAALGPAYTRGERSGELSNTAVEGVEELDAYISEYLPQLFLSTLVPLSILIIVLPLDIFSGAILLFTAPLVPFFMILIGIAAGKESRKQWQALSRLSAHFLDVMQGLTTLKIFGQSRAQVAIIRQISDEFRSTTMSVLRVAFISALVLELLSTIATALVAVHVGLRLLDAEIAFDTALFILILAPEFYLPLRMLGLRFHAGMSGITAAQRIFEVLETPLPPATETVQPVLPDLRYDIRFEAVRFAYDDDRAALNGASFRIAPGHTVALVGPSGAGKSTVIQLLLRFITPTGGAITVDGIPLAALPADEWRAQVAWVPQMPYLFNASIAENIRLARPDAPLDAVITAAEQAHADAFIRALPQGYDTVIEERGSRLSGGQAQRIALARAFLKDAPLVILDEATANLDPETEMQLRDAIQTLMRDRTVLLIAHRLSTVTQTDEILVINEGRIIEHGTHADLLSRNGLYHRLVMVYSGAAQ